MFLGSENSVHSFTCFLVLVRILACWEKETHPEVLRRDADDMLLVLLSSPARPDFRESVMQSAKETGTSLGYGFRDLIEDNQAKADGKPNQAKADGKPTTSDGALKVLVPKVA